MRANIILDDEILKKAFQYSKAKTNKDLIHEALTEFIQAKQRFDLRELRGKIEFRQDFNYKNLRK